MSSSIQQISQNIYSVPADLKVFGLIALNTRMTIVRFENGDLWLHSLLRRTNISLKKFQNGDCQMACFSQFVSSHVY